MQQQPEPDSSDTFSRKLKDLEEDSKALKERIEAEKRRHDMPLDANLGNPEWEERAKDGHLDLPPEDE